MERPRIGVFLCQCGDLIGGHLDVPALAAYARSLPHVVFAQDAIRSCDPPGLQSIADSISTQRLNRAVVASCSPRTHEPLFRATCRQAGLNPYSVEIVNLRDHCAAVHQGDPGRANAKARDLLRMAVFKAALLEPLVMQSTAVEPSALVIGGGIAGLTAAASLGNRGFHVTLVEREPALGGLLRNVHQLYPSEDTGHAFVKEKAALVRDHPNVDVLLNARVRGVAGYAGNYAMTVEQGGEERVLSAGAIIVATGGQELRPTGLFGYDGRTVVTQGELERLLAEGLGSGTRPLMSVVMIQCAGARDETRPYCSRICCMTAIKNAIHLRDLAAKPEVYVLYRDLLALGTVYEGLYREARGRGVTFVQYLPERPPAVGSGRVAVFDELLGETLNIPCDVVVLSSPLVPQTDAHELADMLGVPLDASGFFQEAHGKHRPLECDREGIYLCGSAYFPADLGESVTQAYGAAARASILLGSGQIETEPTVATVVERLCTACGLCEATCPYGAVAVTVVDQRRGTRAARVDPALCRGCGACVAGCRSRAIDLAGSMNVQVLAMIEAF